LVFFVSFVSFVVSESDHMDLRPELMPPALDPAQVARLAELADRIDGAAPGLWEDDLAEFNRLAGTAIPFEHFQGIYGGEDHATWVRRVLFAQALDPAPAVSLEEMTEIVSRIQADPTHPDAVFYEELFDATCQHPSKTDLIFWSNLAPELPQDREPTAAEIAALAVGVGRAG
jgi:hypothetical protein